MTQQESQEFTVSLAEQIANKFDVDIVTCPDCGYVSIQPNDTEDCTCPICGTTADFADFPSLFYSGMEWVTIERVKFYGIDRFNRPVFKSTNTGKSKFYGDVHNLFSYEATEAEVLAKVTADDLCYFGSRFDCEPYGTPVDNLQIVKS